MDDDFDNDAAIDAFHDGYSLFLRRKPRPECPIMANGWDDAQRASRVRVVMPERPEGYYHLPLGTFE